MIFCVLVYLIIVILSTTKMEQHPPISYLVGK